jgi:hypothetical protein
LFSDFLIWQSAEEIEEASNPLLALADILFSSSDIRFRGQSGHHSGKSGHQEMSANDPKRTSSKVSIFP